MSDPLRKESRVIIIHLLAKDLDEGLSHGAWPVTFQSLFSAPSSITSPPPPPLLSSFTFCLVLYIANLNQHKQKGVQNPAGGWHPSRNLACMGSGRSQPLHIHMLNILADLSVAAADWLREDALHTASMHADVHQLKKHSQALVSAEKKSTTLADSCSNQCFIQASYLGLKRFDALTTGEKLNFV